MRSEEQGAQLPGRWRGREPRNAGGLEQLRGPGWRTARTAGSQSCNCRGLASARDREGKAALSSGRERGSQHPTPTPETLGGRRSAVFGRRVCGHLRQGLETQRGVQHLRRQVQPAVGTPDHPAVRGRRLAPGAGVRHRPPASRRRPREQTALASRPEPSGPAPPQPHCQRHRGSHRLL